MSSHVPNIPIIDATKFGWTTNDAGNLVPVLCTIEPVPIAVRTLLMIFCSDKLCNTAKCICIKEGLKCCLEYSCKNCNNLQKPEEADTDTDEDIQF